MEVAAGGAEADGGPLGFWTLVTGYPTGWMKTGETERRDTESRRALFACFACCFWVLELGARFRFRLGLSLSAE